MVMRGRLSDEQKVEVVQRYAAGESASRLAKVFGYLVKPLSVSYAGVASRYAPVPS